MERIFINAKDVQQLTGQSKRTAYRLLQTIKDVYQCKKVTILGFCLFYNISAEEMKKIITKS
jgi:hypothetical protein